MTLPNQSIKLESLMSNQPYAAQSRWDARQTHSAIAVGKSLDGSGFAALIGNLS